jgi:GTPase-activating protein BEM2
MHESNQNISVFGVSLPATVAREGCDIPHVLTIVTGFLEKHCLTQAGIYRVAGAKKEISELKDIFDVGGDPQQLAKAAKLEERNVYSLCDLVKLYFRQLPEPLLGYNLYKPVVDLMRDPSMDVSLRVPKLRELLKIHTPKAALIVLKFIMEYLSKVSLFS